VREMLVHITGVRDFHKGLVQELLIELVVRPVCHRCM
jgi:hypothetical protein